MFADYLYKAIDLRQQQEMALRIAATVTHPPAQLGSAKGDKVMHALKSRLMSKISANSVRQNSLRLVYGREPNVTLVLGDGSTLSVHAQLLAENSHEFANRITFDQFFNVSIYEADAIRILISFLYNGWMNIYLKDACRLLCVAGAIGMPVCVEALCQYLVHISAQSLGHALSCAEIASNANVYFRADCAARMRMNIAAVIEHANNLSLIYEASSVDGIKEILFALQTDTSEQRTRMLLYIATCWLQNRRERFRYAEYIYAMVPFRNLSSRELVEISIALEEQLPNEIYQPLLRQLKQAAYKNHVGANIINTNSSLSFESPTSFREAQSSPEVFDEILMPQNSPDLLSTNLNMKEMAASENGQPSNSQDRVSFVSSSNDSVDSPSIPTIRSPSYGEILPTKNGMLQSGWPTPTSDHKRDYCATSSAAKRMITDHEISNVTNEAGFRSPKLKHEMDETLRVMDITQSVNPVLNAAIMRNNLRSDQWPSDQEVRKKRSFDVAQHCSSYSGIKNDQNGRQTDLMVTIPPYQNTELLRSTSSMEQNSAGSSNHACELKLSSLITIDKTISEQAMKTTQSNNYSVMSPVENKSSKSGRISLVASAEEESEGISESEESEQSSFSSFDSQDWPYGQNGLKNTTKNIIVKDLHSRQHPHHEHNVYGSVVSTKADDNRQKDSRIAREQFDDNRKPQPSKPSVQPDSLWSPEKKSANEELCSANRKRTNVTTMPNMGKQLPVARKLAATHLVLGDDSIISSGCEARQIDSNAQNLSNINCLTGTRNESKSKPGISNRTEIDLSTAPSSSSNDETVRTATSISHHQRSTTSRITSSGFENVHQEKQLAEKLSPIYGNVTLMDISQDKEKQPSDEQRPVKSATVIRCPQSSEAGCSSASPSALQIIHSNTNMKYNMKPLNKREAQIEQKCEFPVEDEEQILGSEYRIIRADTATNSMITSKDDLKTAKGIPIVRVRLRGALDLQTAKEDQKIESDLKTAVDLKTSIENQNEKRLLRTASKHNSERNSSKGMMRLGMDDSAKDRNKNYDSMQDENKTDKTPPTPPSENDLHERCAIEPSDKALKTFGTTSSYTETDLLEKATSSSLSI